MGKFLFVVVVAAVISWYFLKDQKGGAASDKPAVQDKAKTEQVQPAAAKPEKKLPPAEDAVFNPAPGSLAEQLVILSKTPEGQQLNQSQNLNFLNKRVVANSKQNRDFFKANEKFLQKCRELAGCSTLGVKITGNPNQLMPYVSEFTKVCNYLCFAAEHQINSGKKKSGCADLECAVKLLNTFSAEVPNLIHFFTAVRCNARIAKLVASVKIPGAQKKALSAKLAGRKQLANMLKLALDGENTQVLYLRKWADALPELMKHPEPELFNFAKQLQKIPEDKLLGMLEAYNSRLVKAFEENTFDQVGEFNLGTEEENKLIHANQYKYLLIGISKISKAQK